MLPRFRILPGRRRALLHLTGIFCAVQTAKVRLLAPKALTLTEIMTRAGYGRPEAFSVGRIRAILDSGRVNYGKFWNSMTAELCHGNVVPSLFVHFVLFGFFSQRFHSLSSLPLHCRFLHFLATSASLCVLPLKSYPRRRCCLRYHTSQPKY